MLQESKSGNIPVNFPLVNDIFSDPVMQDKSRHIF